MIKTAGGNSLFDACGTVMEEDMHSLQKKSDAVLMVAVVSRVAWVGLWVNLLLSILKIVAGVVGHSRAVVADGIHSLSDLISDVAILVGVHFWSAPADAEHPHGHTRVETLVTVFIGALLLCTALGIAWDTLVTMGRQAPARPGGVALGAAMLSIMGKEALYRWTLRKAVQLRSSALEANAWHHRTDAFSSLPVAAAAGVAWVAPQWAAVDLLGALIVAGFIAHAAWKICRPAFEVLLDKGADEATRDELEKAVCSVPGVRDVHALRTRFLGGCLQVDMHIKVDGSISVNEGHIVALAVESAMYALGPHICDVLVHVDPWEAPKDTAVVKQTEH